MKVEPPRGPEEAPGAENALAALEGRTIAILTTPDGRHLEYRGPTAKTIVANSLPHLVEEISGETRPLVMIQTGTLEETDLEMATRMRDLASQPLVTIMGGDEEDLDQALNMARRLGVGQVFPHDCLLHPRELAQWVGWLVGSGPEEGLALHLPADHELHEFQVSSLDEKQEAMSAILDAVVALRPDKAFQFDVRLILEEILNNALFHAFKNEQGHEIHSIESFERIAEGETVAVRLGLSAETIGLAVRDNGGTLRRDTVLAKVERQMSVKGLLDESGRGLYLTWSLAGRLLFKLRHESLTEVVTLFPVGKGAWRDRSRNKPLLIYEA